MKMDKSVSLWKCVSILLMFILLFGGFVDALGVTPARKLFDFDDGGFYEGSFTVVGSGGVKKVSVNVQGELAEYVAVDNVLLSFGEGDEEKNVNYKIRLPNGVEKPGNNEVGFMITELPAEEKQGTYVGARISVMTGARIRVPYPGKYADVDLEIYDGDSGGNVVFVVGVHDLGVDNIENAVGVVEIVGPTNEIIDVFDTSSKFVTAGRREELMVVWQANVEPGDYHANVVVDYDGEKAEVGKEFVVGGMGIELRNVEVEDFRLGDIAKFKIVLRNRLEQNVEDVYAEMKIFDLEGNLVAEFKTPLESINGRDDKEFLGYWDTAGVEAGTYKAKLIIHYEGKTVERAVETKITANEIKTSFRGTGRAIALSGFDYTFNSVFMIALFVLVFINVCWFVYFKRKEKKREFK